MITTFLDCYGNRQVRHHWFQRFIHLAKDYSSTPICNGSQCVMDKQWKCLIKQYTADQYCQGSTVRFIIQTGQMNLNVPPKYLQLVRSAQHLIAWIPEMGCPHHHHPDPFKCTCCTLQVCLKWTSQVYFRGSWVQLLNLSTWVQNPGVLPTSRSYSPPHSSHHSILDKPWGWSL